MTFKDLQSLVDQSIGQRDLLKTQLHDLEKKKQKLSLRLPAIEETQALIQKVAGDTQEQLKIHIEDIVNTGLETCFPEEYSCYIDFIPSRGKTEADIYLKDYKGNRVNPLQDNGGGLADIVSFSLRLACWTLSKTDPLIVLDEPFKFLSRELRPLAGELLKTLSEKLKLQIIMVTHDEEMIEVADKVFKVIRKGRESEVNSVS